MTVTPTGAAPWVIDAEAALAGPQAGAAPMPPGVDVLVGRPPPLVDGDGARAAVAPFIAAMLWGGAIFRELSGASPLDPIALLLRLLALGLTVRTLLLGWTLLARLRLLGAARRHALVLTDGGLIYRTPRADYVVAREDVLAIRERGASSSGRSGRRYAEVLVVVRPQAGRTHLALPPIFEDTPGILAERLMRWRGADAPRDMQSPQAPHAVPSKVYDDAAAGNPEPGTTVIRHGRGWLRRGPYVTVLGSAVALEGLLRLPGGSLLTAGPLPIVALALGLAGVPVLWWWLNRRDVAPRKGLALVITPAEVLMRTRAGVLRSPLASIERIHIEARPAWSLFEGHHPSPSLVIERKAQPTIRYEEIYLGAPAEVVATLIDAYRRGALPSSAS